MSEGMWMSDDEMLKKSQLMCIVCFGGLTEGFDYSSVKTLMHYWEVMREKFGYRGGFVINHNPTPEQARKWLAENE